MFAMIKTVSRAMNRKSVAWAEREELRDVGKDKVRRLEIGYEFSQAMAQIAPYKEQAEQGLADLQALLDAKNK